VQTGTGASSAYYSVCRLSFPGLMRPGRGI